MAKKNPFGSVKKAFHKVGNEFKRAGNQVANNSKDKNKRFKGIKKYGGRVQEAGRKTYSGYKQARDWTIPGTDISPLQVGIAAGCSGVLGPLGTAACVADGGFTASRDLQSALRKPKNAEGWVRFGTGVAKTALSSGIAGDLTIAQNIGVGAAMDFGESMTKGEQHHGIGGMLDNAMWGSAQSVFGLGDDEAAFVDPARATLRTIPVVGGAMADPFTTLQQKNRWVR